MQPSLKVERALWARGSTRVVGVDEVGLGSLCGPVMAAAVCIPHRCKPIAGVRDSKLLSLAQRERLFDQIVAQAAAVGVGGASVAEIERLNVWHATHLAMRRALRRVAPFDHALIDGRPIRGEDFGSFSTVVDGDALCYSIACASIVAKVVRDRLMRRLSVRYPGYGWEANAGYGTPAHRDALQRLGLTPFHRRSYAPVRLVAQLALAWEVEGEPSIDVAVVEAEQPEKEAARVAAAYADATSEQL